MLKMFKFSEENLQADEDIQYKIPQNFNKTH